jgi:hypothetical protein
MRPLDTCLLSFWGQLQVDGVHPVLMGSWWVLPDSNLKSCTMQRMYISGWALEAYTTFQHLLSTCEVHVSAYLNTCPQISANRLLLNIAMYAFKNWYTLWKVWESP